MKFFRGNGIYGLALMAAAVSVVTPQNNRRVLAASTTTTTIYEADSAYHLHEVAIKADHDGYSGQQGYADFNRMGSYVEWIVNIVQSSDYQLGFRYSAKVSRPCILLVNDDDDDVDQAKIRPLYFVETGAWDIWETETMPLYLTEGTHTLKVLAESSSGPNLDLFSLTNSIHETLEPREVLNRGEFIPSPTGRYEFGLTDNGRLVLRDTDRNNAVIWSATNSRSSGIDICKMQQDGNFVCRYQDDGSVAYGTATHGHDGAHLLVSDEGKAIVEFNGIGILWSNADTYIDDQSPSPISPPPPPPPPTPEPTPSPVVDDSQASSRAVVLESQQYLQFGQFVDSPNGRYRLSFRRDDGFVLEDLSAGTVLWSAHIVGGSGNVHRMFMQDDGNLVIRSASRSALWDSDTYGNSGAFLVITDDGQAMIVSGDGVTELWIVGIGGGGITPTTPAPRMTPSPVPPTPGNAVGPPPPENIVLKSNEHLVLGEFVESPNGNYKLGLRSDGEFVLEETSSGTIVWSAGIIEEYGVDVSNRCYLQSDGQVVVRDRNRRGLWRSETHNNDGSYLAVNDGGQAIVMHDGVPIWLQGIPRGTYRTPSASQNLQFPTRAAFYYPWYPATWTVGGKIARFEPTLGYYSSGDPFVAEQHIDMLEYAYTDLSIASWWGPDTKLDKARITLLMDKTFEMGSSIKWTIYHEQENHMDAPASEIRADLDYLKEWFAWHPTWAHIDRRPVVFVYNEGGCEVAERWMEASNGEWYVVLKLFPGFRDCSVQPDSWHQYGPAHDVVQGNGYSFGVSPGFWKADVANPRLGRLSQSDFCANVERMARSSDPWHLITTFNEAGEGTMVEPSSHWESSSGYGYYLDCLHRYH